MLQTLTRSLLDQFVKDFANTPVRAAALSISQVSLALPVYIPYLRGRWPAVVQMLTGILGPNHRGNQPHPVYKVFQRVYAAGQY